MVLNSLKDIHLNNFAEHKCKNVFSLQRREGVKNKIAQHGAR